MGHTSNCQYDGRRNIWIKKNPTKACPWLKKQKLHLSFVIAEQFWLPVEWIHWQSMIISLLYEAETGKLVQLIFSRIPKIQPKRLQFSSSTDVKRSGWGVLHFLKNRQKQTEITRNKTRWCPQIHTHCIRFPTKRCKGYRWKTNKKKVSVFESTYLGVWSDNQLKNSNMPK